MTNVSEPGILYISMKISPVCRVSTFFDDGFGPLHWPQTSEIRQPLFGNNDLNRVFVVVYMRTHWDD